MSPRGQRHGVHGRARRAYYYNERDKQRAYLRGINNGTIKGPMTLLHEAGKPHDPFKCGECYIERAKVMTDASFIASLHRDGRPHDSDACDGCKNVPIGIGQRVQRRGSIRRVGHTITAPAAFALRLCGTKLVYRTFVPASSATRA